MRRLRGTWLIFAAELVAGVLAVSVLAAAASPYVVTNDDSTFPFFTGVTVYAVDEDGIPLLLAQVPTGGFGVNGGFFGANRIRVLSSGEQRCIYASEAANKTIAGVVVDTLTVGGRAAGSETDLGVTNGIGLAMNSSFLYASFTDSNTIGAFALQPGCGLMFLNDTSVAGLRGGFVNGMAVHQNLLIVTYTDGSIESFDISSGTPVPNGDKQFSTATLKSQGASYPSSIDVTSDGRFAIFGDTSTSLVVEVSDISAGRLAKTRIYNSTASISSSTVMLSPDETILYVVNTQGDAVSALFFNKSTGKLSAGCTSGPLKGQSQNWSYLGGLALINQTGNGGGVYVAEFGGQSGIAMVKLISSGQKCSLQEAPTSPVSNPNSVGLLSIGTFPPRSF